MKKIFLILILLCVCFLVKNVNAETADVEMKWIPNVYYNYTKNGNNYWGQMAYIYADGKIAYCLEVDSSINTNKYLISDEVMSNNLVLLAGYFGYGFNDEKTVKDYLATQMWIWKFLGWDVYFTTESGGRGNRIDIQDYKIKINSRINRYALFPKFDGNFTMNVGEKSYINDLNGIVQNFDILNPSDKNNIYVENNKLVIEGNEVGNNLFRLQTKYSSKYPNVIYTADNSQKIMVIGEVSNVKARYDYNVLGGSISLNINKDVYIGGYDEDCTVEIYNDNGLIGVYNLKDSLKINNLKIGNYKIKLNKVANGYDTDKREISLTINENNPNVIAKFNLKAKSINVEISKKYGNIKYNYIKPDSDINYEIYDKNNNLVDTIKTDENGLCSIKLYYGNYRIVQKNTNNIDIIHDEILISESDFDDNKHFDIFDEINKINLNIIGKYNDENIDFSLDYLNNNFNTSNGFIKLSNLEYGTYEIYNIRSLGYKDIDRIEICLNDELNYYIDENGINYDLIINFEKIVNLNIIGKYGEEIIDFSLEYLNNSLNSISGVVKLNNLDYGTYEISNIKSLSYKDIDKIEIALTDELDYYIKEDGLNYDLIINFEKEIIKEEPIIEKEKENEKNKEEIIVKEKKEIINKIEEKSEDKNVYNNVENEIPKVEIIVKEKKLPNLGVGYEAFKDNYMHFNYFELIWMQ